MPPIRGETLIRAIRMDLGQDRGFGLDVPLSDAMIVMAIKTAIVEYGRYHPQNSYQSFNAGPGTQEYTPAPRIRGIRELSMVPTASAHFNLTIPEMVLIGAGGVLSYGDHFDYTAPVDYVAWQQWSIATETVLSGRPGYLYIPEANKLYVYAPTKEVKVSFIGEIDWFVNWGDELMWEPLADPNDTEPSKAHPEDLDMALSLIPENHTFIWIRKLALADSMKKLGRIFSRYESIPGVDGKDIRLNGPALLDEGKEIWDDTLLKVRLSAVSLVPPVFR